jgi:hypothetical protein
LKKSKTRERVVEKVTTPRHSFAQQPHTPANRELTTFEKATSWVDADGMIKADEGIKRVFLAAADGGNFTVICNVRRGVSERYEYRSYPEALAVMLHFLIQDMGTEPKRNPLLYAHTYNRDALISAVGYKDPDTKRFVSRNDAQADVFQYFLDLWCEHKGIKQKGPAPMIDKLRTPRRKVLRERLPLKRERL